MVRILFLNPNKWGRGITPIWIPSHAAVLKSKKHEVGLFDATFYKNWTDDEISYNTNNLQYKPTNYNEYVEFNEANIYDDLQHTVDDFNPDIIFWSALSSHINGEGEYVNIQYGHDLIKDVNTDAIKIAGGLQPTADPYSVFERFPLVDYFIGGESEFVLADFAEQFQNERKFSEVKGLIRKEGNKVIINSIQSLISNLDDIPPYDYSLFDKRIFYRAYNSKIVKAVDYELSRGCVYACSYCVETTIQNYYGFSETTESGVLKNANQYLRHKSANRIFSELEKNYESFGIELFRCQDTNFLTIDQNTLLELSDLMEKSNLPIKLYIETRPEGINKSTVKLLKKLHVDGVGMGVEVSSESFRKSDLNRHPAQRKIIEAFRILKEAGIKRTAYNIIGLPNETEEMVIDTIQFNSILQPDNITVHFYSPYLGTNLEKKSKEIGIFDAYDYGVDSQLRTVAKSKLEQKQLEFYKRNFNRLVKEGLGNLDRLKKVELT